MRFDFMRYRAICRAVWLISMGFFFGSISGRMGSGASNWEITLAAIGMLVGIFGDTFCRSRQVAAESSEALSADQQREAR